MANLPLQTCFLAFNFFKPTKTFFIQIFSFRCWALRFLSIVFLSMVLLSTRGFSATLEVVVTEGNLRASTIAIMDFSNAYKGENYAPFAKNIRKVILSDLTGSGLFKSLSKKSFPKNKFVSKTDPNFPKWKQGGTEILLRGTYKQQGGRGIMLEISVWDVSARKKIIYRKYFVSLKGWRRAAHVVSDDIYNRMTGESPYFDSQIAFVSEFKSGKKRKKRITIMDSDGFNVKYITSGRYLVLTPRFSPDGKKITYLTYKYGVPTVEIRELASGRIWHLRRFKNMTYAPRFSPDSKRIIFSYASGGRSDIWEIGLNTKRIRRITNNNFIDTSPSYSPDGQSIVFVSNRSGRPQIYIMDKDGGDINLISNSSYSYTAPVWSPRGDTIAFTKHQNSTFYIGVMRVDGSGEKLLSSSFLDEGPSFSPNGRVIVFSRTSIKDNKKKIMSIDITGRNLREIKTRAGASDPSWSYINSRR